MIVLACKNPAVVLVATFDVSPTVIHGSRRDGGGLKGKVVVGLQLQRVVVGILQITNTDCAR